MTITPKSWTKHGKIKKHGGRQDELKGLSKIKPGDEPDVLNYGGKEEVEHLIEHCKFYNVEYDFMKKKTRQIKCSDKNKEVNNYI